MMDVPLVQVVASTLPLWHIDAVSGGGVHSITFNDSSAGDSDDSSGHGHHGGLCSNATLKGPFGFIGHGEILGLIADGTLHPYAAPVILDDVALVTFDGIGGFTRTDFGVIGGLPKGGRRRSIRTRKAPTG
jgi:hypothetical protein